MAAGADPTGAPHRTGSTHPRPEILRPGGPTIQTVPATTPTRTPRVTGAPAPRTSAARPPAATTHSAGPGPPPTSRTILDPTRQTPPDRIGRALARTYRAVSSCKKPTSAGSRVRRAPIRSRPTSTSGSRCRPPPDQSRTTRTSHPELRAARAHPLPSGHQYPIPLNHP